MMTAIKRLVRTKWLKAPPVEPSAVAEADAAAQLWVVKNALNRTTQDLQRAWERDQCESHRVVMLSQEFDHLTQRLRQLDGAARKTYQL